MFSSNGQTGAIAEDVLLVDDEMILENFTVASRGGLDLVGPMRQLLELATEQGAKTVTFRGTFSNAGLAERFGMGLGDAFEFSAAASRDGILNLMRSLR